MVSVCAGLVTVDEESGIIRLVHYTTQEYFERTQKHWFQDAEADIANICVTYLSFTVFESGPCEKYEEFRERLRSNHLYDYAARNWGYHARENLMEARAIVIEFLKSEAKVAASIQLLMLSQNDVYAPYSQMIPRRIKGVHVAAYFGLWKSLITLLEDGLDPNFKDEHGQTPLLWAARYGHEAVVKLLLADNRVDPDCKDFHGWAPLAWAASNGHEAVVKLLLIDDRIDPDSKDSHGRTPLWWAASGGYETVVKLLLADNRVDPNSNDSDRWMPLQWAARYGHEAVVELLLADNRVDPDSKDFGRWTTLSRAARNGHDAIVKLLLVDERVDPDSKDSHGRTPLSWAAHNGHDAIVKALLADERVDPNPKDSHGGRRCRGQHTTGTRR